ncbi:MAG TPA: hypothetical protein VJU13_12245 [Candidatus Nitrosocosmicus sp.]|jgi:hypothetical protein|nr:hypothetical protein [Candidatus Nitrosocosmicus sp.]
MSCIEELEKKFLEFEYLMKSCLPKVDTQLILDILHRMAGDKNPMYTLEIFLDKKPDLDELRDKISNDLEVMPAFYDGGTHVVIAHRIDLKMLEYFSSDENVYRIRGTYTGHGQGASIGPVFERDDPEETWDDYDKTHSQTDRT